MSVKSRKLLLFDLGLALALFAVENSPWILPKADWVRVFCEAVGLVTVAILDNMQTNENHRVLNKEL